MLCYKKLNTDKTSCCVQQEILRKRLRVKRNKKQCGQWDILFLTTRNTVRRRHSVTRNKKHSADNETSCCVQQETQYGRDTVLHAKRNTVRTMKNLVLDSKKDNTKETLCYTQLETQCGQWHIVLCTTRNTYGRDTVLHASRNCTDNETACCVQQETQYGQNWIPTGDSRKESDVAVLQECKRNLDKENVL